MNTIRFCIFLFITWNIANNIISAQPLSDELRFDEHNLYSQNILSNDDINILKAADLMAQGNFLEASSIYQNLYESTREYYFIKQMALAQSQAGNIEKSLEFAKKYQELSKDVDDLETNLIIAEDHIRKGEYNLASILLEKSLQTTPRLQTHYILSNIYMQQKMPDKALEHFIAIYNDEMSMGTKFKLESLNHIITIYLQQEEIDKALIYLNEYIANNEYEINIQNFLALYTKLKKVEVLKENLQKRFAEVQSIENARMLIGVLIQLKEHNEALKILKQNEFLFEQNGKEMFMQIYADKGDFKQATKIAKELYNQTHQIDFLALSAIYEYEVIDNKNKTMLDSLKNSLKQAERVDILTAFFYFSGFNALAEDLKDKKIRILVGNTIDPMAINDLCKVVKEDPDELLEAYSPRGYRSLNNSQKKNYYVESFIEMFNKSTLSEEFDSTESQAIFKMFLSKIKEGTLEIRLTGSPNHAKAYILTNKYEFSCSGDQKGVVFTGSSNFTYNGLRGQGEMNERFSDNVKYEEYATNFEILWEDSKSIDICVSGGNKDFIKELKKKLWLFAQPSPYQIFIRILFELYSSIENSEVHSPNEITEGKFSNFKYQLDAIKYGVNCVNKNNGVIIADVVGLGKSIIAAAIAYNLNLRRTIIITPPHLVEQWNDYQQDFGLRGVRVYSSGRLEELYKTYATDPNPILYIIDEAHRYRNELSESYQLLHQLTRSNADNKVVLLTATPYNNRPQDLFALIKLFQTPSRSTINSVDNLGVRFHELIARYNKLEKEGKKNLTKEIKQELDNLSAELRVLIDPVIVRRSRIDLQEIEEYVSRSYRSRTCRI